MIIPYNVERIYHTWDKWECYPAGFFEVRAPKGMTEQDCHEMYKELLLDIPEFKRIMILIVSEWPISCEHNLTNDRMNRIAWLGQSALCYKHKIPAKFRGGYHLLSKEAQIAADEAALEIINLWMESKGYELQTPETIKSKTEADLY
jgi:hypothetical protein